MKTIETLKQEFVERIAAIGKTKMNIFELCNYADLLKKADELFKPGYADIMANLTASPLMGMCARKKEGE